MRSIAEARASLPFEAVRSMSEERAHALDR